MFKSPVVLGAVRLLLAVGWLMGPQGAPLTAAPNLRQYAPDREFDLEHLILEVTPDFEHRTIAAKATMRMRPIGTPRREIRLDAVDLRIRAVTSSVPVQAWMSTTNALVITLRELLPAGQVATVGVEYDAEPRQGLYFRTPKMGYREGEAHLFTQGESILARHWYPCFDAPNERFTSEIICHVPTGMVALSNGRLVSRRVAEGGARETFHWLQDQPHVSYLVSLVAGPFVAVTDRHREVPLAFHVLPSEAAQATNSFQGTREMMAFFEEEIGIPYPWAKYDQVCVNDFVAGGMENTTLTTLTDSTLFSAASENVETSEGLVAHELAHQWFGDLVTARDWNDIWLNEGFATFYEVLWMGHRYGEDQLRYELFENLRGLTAKAGDTRSIVRRTYAVPDEMFDHLTYPKAAWVLQMIRRELGADLYRRCARTYLERHRLGSVTTQDFIAVLEELSGRSWEQFFDQWVYHGGYPDLRVDYAWDEVRKLARVTVAQQQEVNEQVLLFRLPLRLQFKSPGRTTDRVVTVSKDVEDFEVPLPEAPEMVRVDPEMALLARIQFEVPLSMVYRQLQDADDVIGRVLAAEALGQRKDQEAVDHLAKALREDSFYGVRIEASRGLRAIHSVEALAALTAGLGQPDARVRRRVTEDIGGFYRGTVPEALLQILSHEANPVIRASALQALAAFNAPGIRDAIASGLESTSYRNRVAEAAIRACEAQDDPAWIQPLLRCLRNREKEFTTSGFATGLRALGHLARNEESKDAVREWLLVQLQHPKLAIQRAAIDALGLLGDPRAIAALETFATTGRASPETEAARGAVARLRAARKPIDDLKSLRDEVLELQQSTRDLRQEIDELRRHVPPASPTNSPPAAPPAKPKKPRTR